MTTCEECKQEFVKRHNRQKYCSRKCSRRQQVAFRTNPFRGEDGCDFEPTIEASWFEDEAKRRENRKRL